MRKKYKRNKNSKYGIFIAFNWKKKEFNRRKLQGIKPIESNKKAVAIPFEWIFAIIAGGLILFLAIFAGGKIIGTGSEKTSSETAALLKAYLSPFETGVSSEKANIIEFNQESSIYFEQCDEREGVFGTQTIAFSEKILNKEGKKGEEIPITNKYVFADKIIKSRQIYIFSKPIFLGFKTGDAIIIDSKKYCFYKAPNEIKNEISNLGIEQINFSDDCSGIKVCFNSNDRSCRIRVFGECSGGCLSEYDFGRIEKYDEKNKLIGSVYYSGNFVIPGILSDPELYECNVKRIMKRAVELAKLYNEKQRIIALKGCANDYQIALSDLINYANMLSSSKDLYLVSESGKRLNEINKGASCRLFD